MKTYIHRTIPVVAWLLIGLGALSISVGAQPGNSYGLINKTISAMNIELPIEKEKPNLVILVFDSATCSYEFSGGGEMKLIACHYAESSASVISGTGRKLTLTKAEMNSVIGTRISEVLKEDVESEPEMELKEWMLSPSDWVEK